MSGMYPRQRADRQKQVPTRKRRLVTYTMQPLSEQPGHRFGVNRILRLEDSLLSAGRDGVVRRWDVSPMLGRGGSVGTGRRDDDGAEGEPPQEQPPCTGVFASHTDWVTGLAVAKGRIMASASYDGTLKLKAAGTLGSAKRGLGRGPGGTGRDQARAAAFHGTLAKQALRSVGAGRMAEVPPSPKFQNNAAGGRVTKSAPAFSSGSDAFSPRAASGSSRTESRLRPPKLMSNRIVQIKSKASSRCLTYAEQGGILVSGGLDKRILLWDLQRMSAPLMQQRADDHRRDPSRVVLWPGQAATGPNEVLELCRQNKGSVHCVAAASDASLVASGGTDRMIRLLDPRAGGGGQAAKICKLDGHRDNVRCVKIDEGGTRVVSGSTDGTLRVWDVRQQCCLGVYELPGGSVWAMQPSPCDFDVYYSGGRGRRVYRTDFRTGESTLVCMTNSEVLDMELELGGGGVSNSGSGPEQPMSMWLSSTQPHIALWGGEAGGDGQALRSGRPAAAPIAAAAADGGGVSSSSVMGEGGVGVFDVTPPFAGDETETKGGGEAGGGGRGGGGIDDGGCLLEAPIGMIRGQPGVMRFKVMNNRRHVLTEDDARPQPNVALWDVTKARQVEAYPPGTVFEDKEQSLVEIISVRPWFTVDTHLGTPLVSLAESNVFDGELYAIDARGERQTF
ncbi:unnamed protein product, partial [Scytosiphon promiscuus]